MPTANKQLNKSIMITGASVTGKTTLCRRLMVHFQLEALPVHMTRKMRSGEAKNIDGIFITEQEFKKRFKEGKYLQKTIESTYFSGAYYGFPNDWINCTINNDYRCFVCPTVKMAKKIKKTLGKKIFWINLTSTKKVRIERLIKRSPQLEKTHFDARIDRGSVKVDTSGKDLGIDTSYLNAWEIFFHALIKL